MTAQEVSDIIKEFTELDLSTYPQGEIDKILSKISKYPVFVTILHTGTVIHRARIVEDGVTFSDRSDISFKPQVYNNTYQRASTPNKTMFYGAIIPSENHNEDLNNERIIAVSETCSLIRNHEEYEESSQKIIFGKWRIIQDCELATILFADNNFNITQYSKTCNINYNKWLQENHPDYIKQSELFMDFFASEFAKKGIENHEDYKYMISANLSKTMVKLGLNGVIFPSVKVDSMGINVAIEPNFVNNHMRLEAVCECTVYKKGRSILVNTDKIGFPDPNDQSFSLKELEYGKERLTEAEVKKFLNS